MSPKVDVNGDDAHPLWKWLLSQKGGLLGKPIKLNFTKFLISTSFGFGAGIGDSSVPFPGPETCPSFRGAFGPNL